MKDSLYSRFNKTSQTLRDELAVDRTLLANERTLMAYLCSGVALLIAGVSIIHFSNKGWLWGVGIACLPIGIITSIVGVVRYRKMNRLISLIRRQSGMEMKKETDDAGQ